MTSINHVTLEVSDAAASADFYTAVFGLGPEVRVRNSDSPTTGFRGFTFGLDVTGPSSVDKMIDAALDAGATLLKPPKKQFWGGYSGVVQVPDGTIWKVATTAKRDAGPAAARIERVVLLLGVADVAASKRYYLDQGLVVAKSFGSKYVEFEAGSGAVTLGLYKRAGLAKEFGVSPDGTGSHRLAIGSDAGPFTDPDGFVWEVP
jgi:catechol 2,3-dioxygenase-like lactoylglutathione lyase family enzyme